MVRPAPAPLADPLVGFTVSVMNCSSCPSCCSRWSRLRSATEVAVLLLMVSATTDGGAPGPCASPHPGRVVCGLSRGYDVRRDRLLHAEQSDLVLEVVGGAECLVDAREPQVGDRVEGPEGAEDRQPDLVGGDLGGTLVA